MKLDEDAFLARLLPRLQGLNRACAGLVVPPGDDCAAIAWGPGELLLLAVDQVAAGHHYYGRAAAAPTPPRLAGRKLLARNLSDIAAMGGTPAYALLALAQAPDTPAEWLDEFCAGLLELAAASGVALIGGDVCGAAADVASLSIFGRVPAAQVCTRDRAGAGDRIVVTGAFGDSLASGRHLTFSPRLAEGRWLAEQGFTRCLIDVSDGLLKDLGRVCLAAGLDAWVDPGAVPRQASASLAAAWLDGEDYELIAAVPASRWPALPAAWPFATPLTVLGEYRPAAAGPCVRDLAGEPLTGRLGATWEHFRGHAGT